MLLKILKNNLSPKNIKENAAIILKDFSGKKELVFDNKKHLEKGVSWLLRGFKINKNKGVPMSYSLIFGWKKVYPEVTGYIIPNFLNFTHYSNFRREEIIKTVKKSADFLLSETIPLSFTNKDPTLS